MNLLLITLNLWLGLITSMSGVNYSAKDGYLGISTQDYLIRSWTTGQGLPVNAINYIKDSEEGYLWLTTYDGIVRFDGVNFTIYNSRNTPVLPGNRFYFAKQGTDGEMWFASEYGGIVRLYENEFSFHDSDSGFTDAEISAPPLRRGNEIIFPTFEGLFSYKDGEFTRLGSRHQEASWINSLRLVNEQLIAATNDGIMVVDRNNNYTMFRNNGFDSNKIFDVFMLGGDLYGTGKSTIFKAAADGGLRRFPGIPEIEGRSIYRVYEDRQLVIFVTSHGVVFMRSWDDYDYKNYRREGLNEFAEIKRDRRGRLWLRDTQGRLFQYRNRSLTRFNPAGMLSDVFAGMIFEDQYDNVWIRTENAGLLKITHPAVRTIGKPEGLGGDNMLGIFEDSGGNLWSGSRMNGITRITPDRKRFHFTETPSGVKLNNVFSFEELPDGTIVAGVEGIGLVFFEGNTFQGIQSLGSHPRDNDIRSIRLAHDGRTMWVGTANGLKKVTLDGTVMRNFTVEHGLGSNLVFKLQQTQEGHLWIATRGGISYFDGYRFTRYSVDQGLPFNIVRALYLDRDDPEVLWFGTEGRGIGRLKNGRFDTLNSSGGLHDDLIHNIIEDDYGRLWMSTNRGIFYIRKDEALAYFDGELPNVSPIVFNRNDGMRNKEGNGGFQNSYLLRDDGRLLYSTQNGIAIFDTRRPHAQIMLPIPKIERLSVGNTGFYPNGMIELEPGMNDFTIHFTAFEYSAPEQINFKYKLEGYDREWNIVGSQRSATYTNLPPRSYTFRVTASNHLNIWNNDIATASIEIKPYFYQQPWFYFLAAFLVLSIPFTMYLYRVRSLSRKEELLHSEVMSRTSELEKEKEAALEQQELIRQQAEELARSNQVKDRFFSIIAHDLRSPFGGILGLSRMMDEEYEELSEAEIREYIGLIHESSEHVFKLMENLLSWARLQSGHVKPKLEPIDMEKAVYEGLNVFKSVAEEKGIKVSVISEPNLVVLADANMFDTIIRNLVSNAIKFTHPGGRFTIKTFSADDSCCLQIRDTGVGIAPADMENLFSIDRNKSRNGTSSESGTGLGLPLCKEMAEAQEGSIDVKSEVDKGTTFTIRLKQFQGDDQARQFKVSLQGSSKS